MKYSIQTNKDACANKTKTNNVCATKIKANTIFDKRKKVLKCSLKIGKSLCTEDFTPIIEARIGNLPCSVRLASHLGVMFDIPSEVPSFIVS